MNRTEYQRNYMRDWRAKNPTSRVGKLEATNKSLVDALIVFAACAHDIRIEEPDDDWAKFRLLASDYRRAYKAYVGATGQEPPYPEDVHAEVKRRVAEEALADANLSGASYDRDGRFGG